MSLLADAYHSLIFEPGKATLFWMLLGFLGSFGFIRLSTLMIKAEVSWWPGNVQPGGLHIHHLVFGILIMSVSGVIGLATLPGSPWAEVLAALFGIGLGLTLDEFALFLHLDDVYWSDEGRQSIDAVILTALFLMLLLLTGSPFGVNDLQDEELAVLVIVVGVLSLNIVLCSIALLKGKLPTGLVGMFVPVVSLVGAIRLAHPRSPWARWRYAGNPGKQARSEARFSLDRRRTARIKNRFIDLVMDQRRRLPGGGE